jgi:nucleoid DNA-binding protein
VSNPLLTVVAREVIPISANGSKHLNPGQTMTITKRDLVMRISDETGIPQQDVMKVAQRTLDIIADSLAKGDKVELRNFGVFEVKVRKARVGRNPNAPEKDVPIPQRSVVKFKPGKEMRTAVLKLPPPAATGPAPGPAPSSAPTPPAP